MTFFSIIWNNPITRALAAALAVAAIFVLTYMAGSSTGKRKEKANNKLKALEKRVAIEESQNDQVEQADSIRDRTDADDVPEHHFRDEDAGSIVRGED